MQYYNATIRLAGSTMNEVQKTLTAPEVLILQYVHGVDAVVKVSLCKKELINLSAEKSRLKALYDQALVKRDQSVDTIFGPLASLPTVLPDELTEQFNIIDTDDMISAVKSVTRRDKSIDKSQRLPQNQTQADRIEAVVPPEQVSLEDMAG